MTSQRYRPSSTKGHVAVVKFLRTTLGTGMEDRMIMAMNGMRKKRHMVVYDEMDIVSKDEAKQALRWAEEFVNDMERTMRCARPSRGR